MVDPSDFVRLPYPPDLIQAGILYACRSLAVGLVQASNLRLDPLRCLSAEVAADLSLRRYLAQEHIPFKTLETEPFSKPERSEIILGGRPCHIINALIAHRSYVHRIAASPEALLSAPACVPEAALASESWGYQDLLIFVFTLAVPRLARQASSSAQTGGDLDYLIYIFPQSWGNAGSGRTILDITIQNESDSEITLELGGEAANHDYASQSLQLPPRQSANAAKSFTSLAYLASRQSITTQVSVHNPKRIRSLRITPDRWVNLWADGLGIILAGYIEVGEFRRLARRMHPYGHAWDKTHLSSQSLSLTVQELQPLPQFLSWLRLFQESN